MSYSGRLDQKWQMTNTRWHFPYTDRPYCCPRCEKFAEDKEFLIKQLDLAIDVQLEFWTAAQEVHIHRLSKRLDEMPPQANCLRGSSLSAAAVSPPVSSVVYE